MHTARLRQRHSRRRLGAHVHRIRSHSRRSVLSYGVHVSTTDNPGEVPDRTPSGWARYLQELTSRPGWSGARLARESGVNRSSIYRWMNGRVDNVSAKSVRAIARVVGDDPDRVLLLAGEVLSDDASDIEPADYIGRWEQRMIRKIRRTPGLDEEQQLQRIIRVRQISAEQRSLEEDVDRRSA